MLGNPNLDDTHRISDHIGLTSNTYNGYSLIRQKKGLEKMIISFFHSPISSLIHTYCHVLQLRSSPLQRLEILLLLRCNAAALPSLLDGFIMGPSLKPACFYDWNGSIPLLS